MFSAEQQREYRRQRPGMVAAYQARYREKHAAAIVQRRREHWLLLRAFADAERARGCVDCGEKDFRVLEFDHVRGAKAQEIALMSKSNASVVKFLAELDKCDVRCANCHRRVTAARRQS